MNYGGDSCGPHSLTHSLSHSSCSFITSTFYSSPSFSLPLFHHIPTPKPNQIIISSGVHPLMEGMSKLDSDKQMKEKPHVVVVVKKEEEEFDDELQVDRMKKGKRSSSSSSGGGGGAMRRCQADRCTADLSDEKKYHRKHKVCDLHSKSQVVLVSGLHQRFCQQCSRFHELSEFDDTKRSCRSRLSGHNERRRKNPAESHAVEGSSRNVGTRTQSTHKHFQIK